MGKLVKALVGFFLVLILAEILCRLLPVMGGWANVEVSQEFPMVRYFPGEQFVFSQAWDLENVIVGEFNSLGFISPEPDFNKRQITIIGDSYVEAPMLPSGHRISDVINQTQNEFHSVSLGRAGSDLPDYLVSARWALDHLSPDAIVLVLSSDDLAESVKPKLRGYWFRKAPRSGLVLNGNTNFRVRNLLIQSRFISYVIFNLKFGPQVFLDALWSKSTKQKEVENEFLLKRAAKKFVAELQEVANSGTKILVVFDADRGSIYLTGRNSPTVTAKIIFQELVRKNISAIDLGETFEREYQKNPRTFNFSPTDSHWNIYGTNIVSRAIMRGLVPTSAGLSDPM